jgi:hypothetical protein
MGNINKLIYKYVVEDMAIAYSLCEDVLIFFHSSPKVQYIYKTRISSQLVLWTASKLMK